MLSYYNHLCNRSDMTYQVRKLTETQLYFVSEWNVAALMQMIGWHESFACKIHFIVPTFDGNHLTVISDKPNEFFRIPMIKKLQEYYDKNPKSTNLKYEP